MPSKTLLPKNAFPQQASLPGQPLHTSFLHPPFKKRPKRGEAGFTLTEIAIAMGIFAFALVGILGLLSVGLKNTRTANVQVAASNLLSIIITDIQASTRTYNSGVFTYTTPRLKITASIDSKGDITAVSPSSKILDESGTDASMGGGNPIAKTFLVKLDKAVPGTTAIRVSLQWPASKVPGASPEGTLDALVPIPNL